jgi:negative regulator of flagellin synthesis FlgM
MQIHGTAQVHGAHKIPAPHFNQPVKGSSQSQGASPAGDKLELSDAAQIAANKVETSGMRAERIAQIRQQIADGTYETPEKLDAALDRLLDELG